MQKTQNQAVVEQTNNTVDWDNPTPTTPIGVDYKNIFKQPENFKHPLYSYKNHLCKFS